MTGTFVRWLKDVIGWDERVFPAVAGALMVAMTTGVIAAFVYLLVVLFSVVPFGNPFRIGS